MEDIIVGSKGCSIHDIWMELSKSNLIKGNWSDFAGYLRIPLEDMQKLRQDLHLDKINRNDILRQVLLVWVADQGTNARLTELIRVIEDKCGDNSVGEKLRISYNLACKNFQINSTNWTTLSPAFKEKVEQKLSKFWPCIPIETVKTKLEGEILRDLMTGRKPKLFKSTIPPTPKFYLARMILPRHTISKKIFESDIPDIFLFRGLNEYELGRHTKYETSTCGDQLDLTDSSEICVRFIVLEHMNHFHEIFKRAGAPVHLLLYESNLKTFTWVRTCGLVNRLQGFVEESQNFMTEDNLLETLDGQSGPLLIADSPGMGKSFLLANLAYELEKAGDKIVAFTSVNDFINQFKVYFGRGKSKVDSIQYALENIMCVNELGISELSRLLSIPDKKIELLMDGFDEVSINDSAQALDIIKIIANSFKSIRLWITTRPHHLMELEIELNVLGYNIKGFDEDDQVNFLKSHWQNSDLTHDKPGLKLDKITDYANKVLQKIKSQLNKDENDIAGIPLQCLLIGEVFEEESINFASEKTVTKVYPKIRINSISDLYNNMIAKKLQKYLSTHVTSDFAGTGELINAHAELGLKLLFPEYHPKLILAQVKIDDLLNIGIIQTCGSTGEIEFIHRTFAEYFVARYVADKLYQEDGIESEFKDFLLDKILMRKKLIVEVLPGEDKITSFKFLHHVICYFINASISLSSQLRFTLGRTTKSTILPEVYRACTNSSFLQIFKHFLKKDYNSLDKSILYLAIHKSTYEYFKFIMSCLGERIASFGEHHLSNFLRVAVQRSEPSIVNFFAKQQLFRQLIEKANNSTILLLHDCVSNTKYKPDDDIENRVGVIQLLVEIRPDLLEEKDRWMGTKPLLCEYVHVDLLKTLIILGADVCSQDMLGDTVLHMSRNQTRRLNANEYYSLLTIIPKSKLTQIFYTAAKDEEYPLTRLLNFIDPTEKTFCIFQKETNSIQVVAFIVAIANNRNTTTLKNLIKLGIDIAWKGRKGECYLHYACWYGNLDALNLLIQDYKFYVNTKDYFLQTPMDYAIISEEGNRFETAKVLHNFGGRVSERISSQLQHHLNKASIDGNTQTIRIIHEILKLGNEGVIESKNGQDFILSDEQFKSHVKNFVHTKKSDYKDSHGNSLLCIAVDRSDEVAVKELVENGADLNDQNRYGYTPLHKACFCTEVDIGLRIIKFLIDNGADPCATINDNYTFIDILLCHRPRFAPISPTQFHEITEYLAGKKLVNSIFSTKSETEGSTPFLLACEVLELEERTIMLLKENNTLFNQLSNNGQNVLMCALNGGRSKQFINLLITSCNVDWKHRDTSGCNGLHYAAQNGHLEAIRLLMDLGLDLNQVNDFGDTPLHTVAIGGKKNILETVRILIKGAVDVNCVNSQGQTALDLVVLRERDDQFGIEIVSEFAKILKFGNTDIVKNCTSIEEVVLPSKCLESDEQDQEHLLHKAVIEIRNIYDCWNSIKSLLSTDSNVYAKDQQGYTFLHRFVASNNLSPSGFHEISKYLLDSGYKNLFKTPGGVSGATVVHLSVQYLDPKPETLQLLDSHGINLSHLDAKENSLLMYATIGQRSTEFLSLLINKFGVDYKRSNNYKQNLLHISAQYRNEAAFKFFVNLGIDVNARDLNGSTPIHHAVIFANDNILKTLLGSEFKTKWDDGLSSLHLTADVEQDAYILSVVKLLLENGADGFIMDNDGRTFLHMLTLGIDGICPIKSSVFHQLIQYLVVKDYYKLFHTPGGEFASTPAQQAVRNLELQKETLNLLYSNKVDINRTDNKGYSSLSYAVNGCRSRKLCQELVELGADINQTAVNGQGLLHTASKYGNQEIVHVFIELGLDVNKMDNFGQTPLHLAVRRDDVDIAIEVIKCLVESGADINAMDSDREGLLHVAAKHGVIEVIKFIIDLELNINARNNLDETPLCLAACRKNPEVAIEIIKYLVKKGADLQVTDSEGCGLLHISAKSGISEVVELFVDLGVDVNKKNNFGETPLHVATSREDSDISIEIIKCLVKSGAKLNVTDTNGDGLLHTSANHSVAKVVKMLLELGLDAGSKNNFGQTPLNSAVCRKGGDITLEIIKLLLESGADQNATDSDGNSLLHFAAEYGELKVMEFILEMGLDVNARNNFGQIPLHLAIYGQRDDIDTAIINFFVERGTDLTSTDMHGSGILHYSSQYATPEIVELFVKLGLDINGKNNFKATPLHSVVSREDDNTAIEIIKCLVKNGADANATDIDGSSPLFIAIKESTQSLPLINCLVDNGAKVDSLNSHKTSYIHLAAEVGGVEVLKFLLDMNVLNLNAMDGDGDTSLHCSVQQVESDYVLEKVQLLIECGADVNILNKKGESAFNIVNRRTEWDEQVKIKLKDILLLP